MSGFSQAIQEPRLEAILAHKLLRAVKYVVSLFTHIVKRKTKIKYILVWVTKSIKKRENQPASQLD